MDKLEYIKSMLQHFINDETDKAKEDFKHYLTAKSQGIAGINSDNPSAQTPEEAEEEDDATSVANNDFKIDDGDEDVPSAIVPDGAESVKDEEDEIRATGTE